MKISESAQEQLEQLWIITVENGSMIPIDAGLSGEYEQLIQLNLVELLNEEVHLTPAGNQQAALAIRRHRLAERLFSDILATEETLIDEAACSLEHALFDGIEESICTLLGHPTVCPHGKQIPPGVCCKQGRKSVSPVIVPLNELKRQQSGRIAYLCMEDSKQLQKIMAMGILPGTPITIKEIFPVFVLEAGYSQFAIDEQIAAAIYVRVAKPG